MDTPERNQIGPPVPKFEDSPVFNFLNSLSPIKPVKSVHITQTLNALSFSSLPSIFTSPHVSSLKESRFLRRHSDPPNPELPSENAKKFDANEEVTDVAHKSVDHQENFDPCSVELSRTLTYDCGSPIARCGNETKSISEFGGTSTSIVPYGQDVSDKGLFGNKVNLEGMSQIEQNKEGAICDWETMISDASDLLIFDSPNETLILKSPPQKTMDPGTRLCTSLMSQFGDDLDCLQRTHDVGQVCSFTHHETENLSTQPEEGGDLNELDDTQDMLANASLNQRIVGEPNEERNNEFVPYLQRGIRRRCLVFEMAGARRKHLDENSGFGSPVLLQADGNNVSNDNQAPKRPGNEPKRCVLPGIGLHLNALATTSKEYKGVKHETLVSGRLLINEPCSTVSVHSLTTVQEPVNKTLALTSVETDMVSAENGVQAGEEYSQGSPKKKRRRSENGGDSEGCKRCNCKKSKCLKLYCECFAAGVYCVEPCSCQECFNKPIHEDTVLATRKQIESRNPLAFAPKVIRSSDAAVEDDYSKTPASARHKRGCNCKKSGCLKKYCECYQGGVGCSINCRCEGCKNAFGRKDGSVLVGTEGELEEEETETCENSVVDKSLQMVVIQNDTEQNPDSGLPATPLQFRRSSIQLPFSSKGKPPRSSLLSIGSSSGSSSYGSQRFGKSSLLHPQAKFEKQFQTIREDEMPEILQENCSPISGVKTSSPNSKRISPPHCDFGFSPGRRSSRKLILQSIPSFPSLTPKH